MNLTPIQKRNLTYGAVALAVIVGGYYMFFKKEDDGGSDEDPTGNSGSTPVNLEFNAANAATALYNAMKNTGTDEDKIFAVLKNVNQTQFGQIVKAFGRRSYNPILGNQINQFPLITTLPLFSLIYWLKSELSKASYETLRLKYPNYL